MPGAGKSTIVDALKEDGYFTLTLGDGVRTEAKRRNLEPTGENLGKIMLELREKNGLNLDVQDYVLSQESAEPFLIDISSLLNYLIPTYENEGKSYLSVAFGCTGGKHRSVAIAEELARILKMEQLDINTFHRDISR